MRNTEKDQSWKKIYSSVQFGNWVQTWPYIHKIWTSFGTSSGSDYPRNDSRNPRYDFQWSTNESALNSWGYRHITKYSVFIFARKIGCEQNFSKMGAAFALRGESTQSYGRRWGYFDAFLSQSWRVSLPIHKCGWNMYTPLHSSDKGIVKAVGFWRRTGSAKGEDDEVGRQGDGHGFLVCTWNHIHSLLSKRINDNWSVLCVVIAPVERRNQEKTYSFEKEKDPLRSRQCMRAHLRSFDGQHYEIKIRIITTSTVFAGFGPQWLFYFEALRNGLAENGSHQTR